MASPACTSGLLFADLLGDTELMVVTASFHSSTGTPKGPATTASSRPQSAKYSPMDSGAPSEVTEAAFSRWKIELQNKLIVQDEKERHAERREYKHHEDKKFWERKTALHRKTADQFGKAKMEVEAVRQKNLTRGAEYKAELEEMKEQAAQQREEWMQTGHELTVQHGPEQAERTKARLAETAESKAEQGRQVKQDAIALNKARIQQRTNRLEEKREIVEQTKQEEYSVPEESKNFSFHMKEDKGSEVRSRTRETVDQGVEFQRMLFRASARELSVTKSLHPLCTRLRIANSTCPWCSVNARWHVLALRSPGPVT